MPLSTKTPPLMCSVSLVCPAQVLASIGQLEFFYDQAPDVMRSCSMALQLLSVCIGSYLSGALVAAISSATYHLGADWLPQDLNYGRLDLFFLLLAGGQRAGTPRRALTPRCPVCDGAQPPERGCCPASMS